MNRIDYGRSFFALVLIGLGVLFLLDQTGQIDAGDIIGNWWPVLIIAFGVMMLLNNPRGYLGALIIIAIGAALLVDELKLLSFSVWDLWPLILIGIGVLILLGRSPGIFQDTRTIESGDAVNSFVAFGGKNIVNESKQFSGGSITALFGGSTLDLRHAQLAGGRAKLSTTAAFGAVEVIVPQDWRVDLHGVPLFGGMSNKAYSSNSQPTDAPTLTISGTAAFGGIEVKN